MQEYLLMDILFSDEIKLLQTMLKKKDKDFRREFVKEKGRVRIVCNIKEIAEYLKIAKEHKPLYRSYEFSNTRKIGLIEKLENFIKDHS